MNAPCSDVPVGRWRWQAWAEMSSGGVAAVVFGRGQANERMWPPDPAATDLLDVGKRRELGSCTLGHGIPRGERASHGPIRIPLPAHDPFRSIHEERGKAADPVPHNLPHATQGLGIHEPHDHPLAILLARVPDPVREAEIVRLEVLSVGEAG